MSDNTAIEWADTTWNPVTGCDRISPGCDHCYALTMAKRLKAMGQPKYQNDGDPRTSGPGFGVTTHPGELTAPTSWRTPRKVFVNSMSDLFHARVPISFVRDVFDVIQDTPQHTYQVLTKRAHRLARLADQLPWPGNLWMGVTVESADQLGRVRDLCAVPAAVRFLSCEPLLSAIDISPWLRPAPGCGFVDAEDACCTHPANPSPDCNSSVRCPVTDRWRGIDWVIAGGESGPGARPMHPDWARSLRDQCTGSGVPFFFKQWGNWAPISGSLPYRTQWGYLRADGSWGCPPPSQPPGTNIARVGKKAAGRELDGRTWDEFPAAAA